MVRTIPEADLTLNQKGTPGHRNTIISLSQCLSHWEANHGLVGRRRANVFTYYLWHLSRDNSRVGSLRQTLCGPQRLKYLPSAPSQKNLPILSVSSPPWEVGWSLWLSRSERKKQQCVPYRDGEQSRAYILNRCSMDHLNSSWMGFREILN